MGVLMTSIVVNNSKENIVFHIITRNIDTEQLKYLASFSNKYFIDINIYIIDSNYFKNLPTTSYISQATYNRFLIPLLLKGITSKVLYLDADIICLGNIKQIFNIKLDNITAGVIEESNNYVVQQQIKNLELQSNKYFNAGVLYINIDRWIERDINAKIINIINTRNNLEFMDQDILNIVLEDDCKYIDKIYNYTFDVRYKINRYVYDLPKNIVFLHYVGKFKPWQEWCLHPAREFFREYAIKSLWKDIPWSKPVTYKDMKNMALSYKIYKYKLKSIYWYLRYAIKKIKTKVSK